MKQTDDLLAYVYQGLASRTKENLIINENTELIEQLKLDSLHIMELLLDIEDLYEISIPVSVLNNVKTVRDLVKRIEQITVGDI